MLTELWPLPLQIGLPGLHQVSRFAVGALASRTEFGKGPSFSKELAMSIPDPILNFRVPRPIKDMVHLLARRTGKKPGPLMREWMTERLVTESALSTYRAVGLLELQRRLARPSPSFSYQQDSTEMASEGVQTEENIVSQGHTGRG
jgi:hypothetical protein